VSARPLGKLFGVGTGPGDPELMTLKAVRVLGEADVVAHFAKRGNNGNARASVSAFLKPGVIELALLYPVTTEIAKDHADYRNDIANFYEESARNVAAHLEAGRKVAVLSEGDPLFYGSYMHLHVRLAGRYPAEVVPGVTAMSGCWSQAGLPLAQGDDVLSVLPGTMSEFELTRRLADTDAAVIMKVGRNLPKIRRALEITGRLSAAIYVERGTMDGTFSMPLGEKGDDRAPYFSIVLVPGWATRP
jgi:precorrin-2/cobalt-factor-2 C20-methyltransferase